MHLLHYVTRLFVSLIFIENGLITNKNIFMYKIPACKIPFLCYWHPDRNKATEHFQSVLIDNLVVGNKVSENAGVLDACAVSCFFSWICVIYSVFPLGFCFFLVFSSLTAIFHLAAVWDPVVKVDLSFCLHKLRQLYLSLLLKHLNPGYRHWAVNIVTPVCALQKTKLALNFMFSICPGFTFGNGNTKMLNANYKPL